jgi:hypothetical protein
VFPLRLPKDVLIVDDLKSLELLLTHSRFGCFHAVGADDLVTVYVNERHLEFEDAGLGFLRDARHEVVVLELDSSYFSIGDSEDPETVEDVREV